MKIKQVACYSINTIASRRCQCDISWPANAESWYFWTVDDDLATYASLMYNTPTTNSKSAYRLWDFESDPSAQDISPCISLVMIGVGEFNGLRIEGTAV